MPEQADSVEGTQQTLGQTLKQHGLYLLLMCLLLIFSVVKHRGASTAIIVGLLAGDIIAILGKHTKSKLVRAVLVNPVSPVWITIGVIVLTGFVTWLAWLCFIPPAYR